MIDFNKSLTVTEARVSSNHTFAETIPISRKDTKTKRSSKKQLTKDNKRFLKLIGLLK